VITIYDNTAASGRILFQTGGLAAATVPAALPGLNIPFYVGLTFSVATQNAAVMLNYE
jgi:hypothetical protein